ncbi:MAG TPA: PAS domain S-box protein [Armatimonadota bacterium]|nr:PAS domain S-box protein [Armatimonadota bacterium]
MIRQVWTEETVIAAIRGEAARGHDLSYSSAQRRVPSLLRAAERVFGQWAAAVEAAGFDYAAFRKYRRWTRETVIAAIRAHAESGADLSWRHVSTALDPPLAYAALHAGRFPSWDAALAAAGLDPDTIRRYQNWNWDRVVAVLWSLAARGILLDQPTLSQNAPDALAAFYRRGGSLRELRAHYATAETSPTDEPLALITAAVEHDPHAVMVTDAQGCVTYVNRAYAASRGVTAAEMVGRHAHAAHWRTHAGAEFAAMWREVLARGEWYGEYVNQRLDGTTFREAASIATLAAAGATHVIVVFDEVAGRARHHTRRGESLRN